MGSGSFTFHSMRPNEGLLCPPYMKINIYFMHFQISIIVLGNIASRFLLMIMRISKVGLLIQIRMGVGNVIFAIMASIRGQYAYL